MKALVVFLLSLASHFAGAASDAPRMGTVLADSLVLADIKPGLILGHENTIYFTGAGNLDCPGLGLYRLELMPSPSVKEVVIARAGEALKSPLCVQSLATRRGKIQIRHRLAAEFTLDILNVGNEVATLSPVIGPALKFKGSGVWNWTRGYLKQNKQWPEDISWYGFDFVEGETIRLVGVNSLNHIVYLAVSLNARNDAPLATPVQLGAVPEGYTADIRFTQQTQVVAVLRSADPKKLGRLFLWDLSANPIVKTELGHDFAYVRRTIWDETHFDDWSARNPQAVAISPLGLFVTDSTTFANEKPLLAIIPLETTSANTDAPRVIKRVKGLYQDWMSGLKSLCAFKNGLLLVYDSPTLIAFVGDKNPFPEEIYPTRRADLQEIGVREYQELLQEVNSK